MNVYDFDKTIFYPDSSFQFSRFCLKRYPKAFIQTLNKTLTSFLEHLQDPSDSNDLKESIFAYLKYIPDIPATVEEFWNLNETNIQSWYLKQRREDDLIISASPEFLIAPIAKRLGVRYIATKMSFSGKIQGANCHDEEKVRRFLSLYPDEKVEAFYSDSLSDTPMAQIAEKAYLVNKDNITQWPE